MAKKKVVMAFGAFDGVHSGHIHYLKGAKGLGDYLIVSIARDKSEWKFPRKYNLPELERKKLVEDLGIADKVILGSIKNALDKILKIKPDIIAITSYHPVDKKLLESELREKIDEYLVIKVEREKRIKELEERIKKAPVAARQNVLVLRKQIKALEEKYNKMKRKYSKEDLARIEDRIGLLKRRLAELV